MLINVNNLFLNFYPPIQSVRNRLTNPNLLVIIKVHSKNTIRKNEIFFFVPKYTSP